MCAVTFYARPGLAVGTVGAEGVPDVHEREQAGGQRDLVRPPGRAGSRSRPTSRGGRTGCPAPGAGRRSARASRRRTVGWRRMTAHSSSVSGPGLSRMWSGIAHLADVVQQGAPADLDQVFAAQAERDGQAHRQFGHAAAVAFGLLVAQVQRAAPALDGRVVGLGHGFIGARKFAVQAIICASARLRSVMSRKYQTRP